MKDDFKAVSQMRYWCQKVLPLVYDDSLSYYELLGKIVKKLNDLIENNSNLPDYIEKMIREYITSGAIGEVVRNILTDYMLNVKNPPEGLTPATGDGSADDTEAIQGCIDYANANGGKAVYFPSGSYLTQSLVLKDNVSLVGFDTSTTKLVLKGGAIFPLIYGTTKNNTIKGLRLDGNMDIQVNNINVVGLVSENLIMDNVVLTDGYDLLNLTVSGTTMVSNIITEKAVENAVVFAGEGELIANNIFVNHLSAISGNNSLYLNVDNAIVTNLKSIARTSVAIYIASNNCTVTANVTNADNTCFDGGENNSFYSYGDKVREILKEGKAYKADYLDIDIVQPLGYKEPTELNEYFKTVPFKYQSQIYQVLVLGGTDISTTISGIKEQIEQEIADRKQAIIDLQSALELKIEQEKTDRINADNVLTESINQEIEDRIEADNVLDGKIEAVDTRVIDVEKDLTYLNVLKGKKILILGDSISDEAEASRQPNWVVKFREKLSGIAGEIKNVSLSGRRLSGEDGTANLYSSITGTFDHIIIFLGTNDCTAQINIGKWYDNTVDTFMGAINYLNEQILMKNPTAIVHYITPLKTNFDNDIYKRPIYLDMYRMCIYARCNVLGWKMIDAHADAPLLNPYNNTSKSLWQSDGLHPNTNYSQYFADYVIQNMLSGGSNKVGIQYNVMDFAPYKTSDITALANLNGTFMADGRMIVTGEVTFESTGMDTKTVAILPEFLGSDMKTIGSCYMFNSTLTETYTGNVSINNNAIVVYPHKAGTITMYFSLEVLLTNIFANFTMSF